MKLSLKEPVIVPWVRANAKGFLGLGRKYVHYSDLSVKETAIYQLSKSQKIIFLTVGLVLTIGIVASWKITLTVILSLIIVIYFADLFFNLYLISKNFNNLPEINISQIELSAIDDKSLPKYTIMSPLYKESSVLLQYINAMSSLDYPKDKLQVLILIEEDDSETFEVLKKHTIPSNFEIKTVPQTLPKTKPKALNYGLNLATGEYIVVYDAEDAPEKDQLKKAVLAFRKSENRVKCIQAKLDYYNPRENIITRLFTLEYALWFDVVLPGIQSIYGPIPLGGSSNHFQKKFLTELKAWDSFNVTEDCDLGIRLSKKGYLTAMIDSTTYEQATDKPDRWFWQRTRWIKGYLQTYLIHMRNPKDFLGKGKRSSLMTFQSIVGGKILLLFINPIMWFLTICYLILRTQIGSSYSEFFPTPFLQMGFLSLVVGNFLYLYYYMIGAAKRGHWSLTNFALFVPLYWLSMSAAAFVALYKLLRQPHYWTKTTHRFVSNNLADFLSYDKYKPAKFQ